jgi:murein DD-endopeptidase MepM/ murein hydrolase activator NlpD
MRRTALAVVLALIPLGHAAALAPPPRPVPSAAWGQPGGWIWPVRPAEVVHAFDRPAEPWLSGHRGVDLAARPGQPVRSAGAGRVLFAGSVGGVPVVTVEHADGLRTTYQPVEATVTEGEPVRTGERIGQLTGDSGHCTPESCLHWGLLRGEDYLDPLLLVLPATVRLLPLGDPLWGDTGI